VPAGQFTQDPIPPDETLWAYYAELSTPFVADLDTRYWIEIQGVLVHPPAYGWVGSGELHGWRGTQGSPMHGLSYWSRFEDADINGFVFTLYGQVLSEADFNQDGSVDLADVASFETCFSGQGNPYDPERIICARSDLDDDDDVDLDDFAVLHANLTGPSQ